MPPRRTPPSPRLPELRALSADPAAQVALAQTILATDKDVQAIRAALEALKAHPTPAARRVLEILCGELPLKQAVKLTTEITGGKKNELYALALEMKEH